MDEPTGPRRAALAAGRAMYDDDPEPLSAREKYRRVAEHRRYPKKSRYNLEDLALGLMAADAGVNRYYAMHAGRAAKKALNYLAQAASAKKPEVKSKSLRLARKHLADISAERHPELTEQIESRLLWEEGHRPETDNAKHSVNPETGAQEFFGFSDIFNKVTGRRTETEQSATPSFVAAQPPPPPRPPNSIQPDAHLDADAPPSPKSLPIPEIRIKGTRMPDWDPVVEEEIARRAAAIFGETASLRPQLIDPEGSVDNPENWNPESAALLHQARTKLAAMHGGPNPRMKPRLPSNVANPIEKRQWDLALKAAEASMGFELDPRLGNMFMRQKGVGDQVVDEWIKDGSRVLDPIGPFINTYYPSKELINRGRAAGGGPNMYIDFYGRDKPGS